MRRVTSFGVVLMFLGLVCSTKAYGEQTIVTETVTYKSGDVTCQGYLAYDSSNPNPRPGVLVVHEWWGLNKHAKEQTVRLAKLGYIAFACDMYGEGKLTEHPQEAGKMAGMVRENVAQWRDRATDGLKVLTSHKLCQSEKVGAIGYCFGGSTALQLAYTGADLKAVVTFHAALPSPTAAEAGQIKGRILVNHGALDTFISPESIQSFRSVLDAAKADYSMVYYSGTVHSFTVPTAGDRGIPGMAYNEHADKRSWSAMLTAFEEAGLTPPKTE
ncbi:MAG: dienelactone hydrolase family protein [Planctomycetaceae bacterium]